MKEGQGLPRSLKELPIPSLESEQLKAITEESLHVKSVGTFNPSEAQRVIADEDNEGRHLFGVDLGGGKATVVHFIINQGSITAVRDDQETVLRGSDAAGYLPLLERLSDRVEEVQKEQQNRRPVLVGVSCAGVVEGTHLIQTPNMPTFQTDLFAKYGGNFANENLLPTVTAVNNDAEAAIKAAIINATLQGLLPEGEGEILAMEPGHMELLNLRRPLGQEIPDEPCGMFDQQFVCVERAVGGAAGIESRWEKITRRHLDGRQISELYQQGNPLATELYNTSATLLATTIQGIATTLDLTGDYSKAGVILPIVGGGFGASVFKMDKPPLHDQNGILIAFHGGVNNVPKYMERVVQILGKAGTKANPSFTEQFSVNAGAEGAVIAALMAEAA